MDTEPIRQDIDAIRSSMTDKMEQIESKVRGTVEHTVSSVKETFDLKSQVAQRPWVAFGAAVLAGFALGSMGGSSSETHYPSYRGEPMRYYPETDNTSWGNANPRSSTNYGSGSSASYSSHSTPVDPDSMRAAMESSGGGWSSSSSQGGMLAGIADQFGGEIDALKAAAITAGMNALRDLLRQNLPRFADEYERIRGGAQGQAQQHGLSSLSSHGETLGRSQSSAYSDRAATVNVGGVPNDRPATYAERAPGSSTVDTSPGSSVGGMSKDEVRTTASANPLGVNKDLV